MPPVVALLKLRMAGANAQSLDGRGKSVRTGRQISDPGPGSSLYREVDWYFTQIGIIPKMIAPGAPVMNYHAEQFVRKIKHECLNHCVFLSEKSLRTTLSAYVEYYHIPSAQTRDSMEAASLKTRRIGNGMERLPIQVRFPACWGIITGHKQGIIQAGEFSFQRVYETVPRPFSGLPA